MDKKVVQGKKVVIYYDAVPKKATNQRFIPAKNGKKARVVRFKDKKLGNFENYVKDKVLEVIGEHTPYVNRNIPIRLYLTYYRDRPTKLAKGEKYPCKTPDLVNIIKSVEDGMQKKTAIEDDCQTMDIIARKRYVEVNGRPRIEIVLTLDISDDEWDFIFEDKSLVGLPLSQLEFFK